MAAIRVADHRRAVRPAESRVLLFRSFGSNFSLSLLPEINYAEKNFFVQQQDMPFSKLLHLFFFLFLLRKTKQDAGTKFFFSTMRRSNAGHCVSFGVPLHSFYPSCCKQSTTRVEERKGRGASSSSRVVVILGVPR